MLGEAFYKIFNKEIRGLQSNKLPITKFADNVIEKIDRGINKYL